MFRKTGTFEHDGETYQLRAMSASMADDMMMIITLLAQSEPDDEDDDETAARLDSEKVEIYQRLVALRRKCVAMCLDHPAIADLLKTKGAQEVGDNELDPDFVTVAWEALEDLSGVGALLDVGEDSEEELEKAAGNSEGDPSDA
ncbi:MAG: hypothetical protein AAF184_09700 [Pseudomonadota bacterium]